MDREEILLKEYEVCQSHNNALGQQAWVSISIFITVNFLVLGDVVDKLLLTSYPINGYAKLLLVIAVASVLIFILKIFRKWDKRIDFMVLLNNERMRYVETELKMWKNWRVYGLDLLYGKEKKGRQAKQAEEKWRLLNQDQREYIQCLYQCLLERTRDNDLWKYREPTTKGILKFDYIIPILAILWGLVIVLEALIYFCPFIQNFLFN